VDLHLYEDKLADAFDVGVLAAASNSSKTDGLKFTLMKR